MKRVVDTSFWTDDKVIESFSIEDKLFFLYLMTNPHTTQLGVYHINKRVIAFETGLQIDTVEALLNKFEHEFELIKYSNETSEVAIKNYLKHSIVKGGKPVEDCLMKDAQKVKNKGLLEYLYNSLSEAKNLNASVQKIVPYLIKNNINNNIYINNNNDNDNDNEVSYPDSHNESCNDTHNKSSKSKKNIYVQEFDEVWDMYPKKQGKSNALKAYTKARTEGVSKDEIVQGLKNYTGYISRTGTEQRYVKMGSTWFNQRCWEDNYDDTGRAKRPTGKKEEPTGKEEDLDWFFD